MSGWHTRTPEEERFRDCSHASLPQVTGGVQGCGSAVAVISTAWPDLVALAADVARSVARRGRGHPGPLFPPDLPAARTRAEVRPLVLELSSRSMHDCTTASPSCDIAVDEVPRIRAIDPDSVNWPPEVVADGPVPLSRLIPAGIDRRGTATRARNRPVPAPIELRAKDPQDLEDLVHDVLVEQVSTYLGVDPEVIDPIYRSRRVTNRQMMPRLRRRRSRSDSPPQIPKRSSLAMRTRGIRPAPRTRGRCAWPHASIRPSRGRTPRVGLRAQRPFCHCSSAGSTIASSPGSD